MKRSLVFSLFVSLALAGCGVPQDDATTRGEGGTAMEGPDADGNFYVVGFAGAAAPGELVTVVNASGDRVSVNADADGSFAAIVWSSMDKAVEIETAGALASAATNAPQKINVNFASRTGLEAVPGIGPTLAMRVIERRTQVGLFSEVEDLESVEGIGPASLEKLRPFVETKIDLNVASKNQLLVLPTIGASKAAAIIAYRNVHGSFTKPSDLLYVISLEDYDAVKAFVKTGEISVNPGAALVNVNTDGVDALLTLNGIGEAKAKAIVDYRENHGVFYSKDDLLYVPGIGPSTLGGIRDHVTVGILDRKVGTFVAEGTWEYSADGDATGSAFPTPVLVKFEHSIDADELLVTFVGGGFCYGTDDCAPFTLKGKILEDSAEGARYRLSGLMPSEGGSFQVFGNESDEGLIRDVGATIQFRAIRGLEEYRLSLNALRVLE